MIYFYDIYEIYFRIIIMRHIIMIYIYYYDENDDEDDMSIWFYDIYMLRLQGDYYPSSSSLPLLPLPPS